MALRSNISKEDFLSVFQNLPFPPLAENGWETKALEKFKSFDFPSKSDEKWRHTNISRLLQHHFGLGIALKPDKKIVDSFTIPGLDAYRMVFVNGYFFPEFSNQINGKKIIIKSLASAKSENKDIFELYFEKTRISDENFFTNLNTAYATNGNFIYIDENTVLDKPLQIINFSDGKDSKTISQYRNIILARRGSKAQIITSYHSLSVNFTLTNAATEIFLEADAHLNFNIFQGEGDDAFHVNHTRVIQETGSRFSAHTLTMCGAIVRNDIQVKQAGEGCDTKLNGLYLPSREQHFDNNTFIHHAKPHGTSNQVYKGIIDNKSSAVFLGKVLVDRDAQKINAYQSNRNILLTKYAKVNSKPQLEIYADDVACSHGSTTGQIDKEALFYLQSRGINRRHAELLLLSAFIADVIETIEIEPLRMLVKLLISKRLDGENPESKCSMDEICHGCDML
ncbi:MAG: Fe-S cluster assembly protein SufD [Bacteroidales bacterium]